MSTQHIGAAGELLVQYRLLKMGIDSAWMTTDAGVDWVVYVPGIRLATRAAQLFPQVSRRLLDARHVSASHREILQADTWGVGPRQIAEYARVMVSQFH